MLISFLILYNIVAAAQRNRKDYNGLTHTFPNTLHAMHRSVRKIKKKKRREKNVRARFADASRHLSSLRATERKSDHVRDFLKIYSKKYIGIHMQRPVFSSTIIMIIRFASVYLLSFFFYLFFFRSLTILCAFFFFAKKTRFDGKMDIYFNSFFGHVRRNQPEQRVDCFIWRARDCRESIYIYKQQKILSDFLANKNEKDVDFCFFIFYRFRHFEYTEFLYRKVKISTFFGKKFHQKTFVYFLVEISAKRNVWEENFTINLKIVYYK